MNLKEKFFSFGIFGEEVSKLSSEELEEAKSQPWIEILSPQQVDEFKSNFTLSAIKSDIKSEPIPDTYRVRMSLMAWRSHLFGPSFLVTNKFYFHIVDHLLRAHGFVALSTLREIFKIDPKTMFYICKKLTEKNVIQEKKEDRETLIKLVEIRANVECETQRADIYTDATGIETSNLVFYSNIPFIEQLKIHVTRAENGLDSKDLLRLIGMKTKFGLKHLQRLCQLFPEEFKLVSSIDNKHTVFKCFAVENLEKRNTRKLERMKGIIQNLDDSVDTLLSSKDRQSALQILAERLGHFNLSKENMKEISRMTGYPYEIDRKNIISNAKAAGLQVFTIPQTASGVPKYIIALPKYDESIIELYVATASGTESSKFYKKLTRFFLNIESCVVEDNGYPPSSSISNRAFHRHLSDAFGKNGVPGEYLDFNYETVMEMSVKCFYETVKIRSLNFRAKCAFEVFKKQPGCPTNVSIEDLFVGSEEPKKLDTKIFLVQDEIKDIKIRCYVDLLPDSLRDSIREFAKPNRFMKKLRLLEQQSLIELNLSTNGRISFRPVGHGSMGQEKPSCLIDTTSILFFKGNLNYNKRCEFLHKMKNVKENNFMEVAEKVMSRDFSKSDQKLIYKYVCTFAKTKRSKRAEGSTAQDISTEEQQGLYLLVKKAAVFQLELDLIGLIESRNVDVEEILDYMNKKDVITGFRAMNVVSNIAIHPKFKAFLGDDFPDPCREVVTDERYFRVFFTPIVSVVREYGSIDFDALLSRIKFLESFELSKFLELNSDMLERKIVDGFVFISLANLSDPFS